MITNTGFPVVDSCQPQHCIASKIMKSHRIINGIFRKHLKAFGITNSQMSILFVLSKKGQTTQNDLCQTLFLEKSTISRNMKRLYESDYVANSEFPNIKITKKGLQLLETIIPHWEEAMQEVTSLLKDEGVNALDSVLIHLTQKN